ncbi:MAG: histidine kinase [Clostridia bacterium]|nr:histidine kinase [Clostridia bacterium]
MRKEKKRYSLQRRIMLFYVVPLFALLSVLFIYIKAYRSNVETLAEATFQNLAATKHQQLEENFQKIGSISKDIAYSSVLQQYLLEMEESEKVKTYAHLQNYLRAVSTNSPSVVSVYASIGSNASIHMGDGYFYMFEEARNKLKDVHEFERNSQYLIPLKNYASASDPEKIYGMCFYVGSTIYAGGTFKNQNILSGVMYDPYKLIEFNEEAKDHIAILTIMDTPVVLSGDVGEEAVSKIINRKEKSIFLSGREFYLSQKAISGREEIQLIYLVPRESLVHPSNVWQNQATAFIVLSALVLSLSVTLIINSIFLPIRQMSREVEALSHYGEMLTRPRAKELAALTDTFNDMSLRISRDIKQEKEMMDQQYQLEIQKNRMEMQAFRNQINPHFLFNTLECINAMVRYYKLQPVSKLITNLSGCFRYSLYSPMLVKLSEEIDHLMNYLDIIETRFPGKYRFVYSVDEKARQADVPSLLLQPLAENAVTHAFIGKKKKARPTIVIKERTSENAVYLKIDIVDNGMGMDDEKLKEITSTMKRKEYVDKHISLNNVYRRLMLLYGKECMSIQTKYGCYTKISVRIPVSLKPDMRVLGDKPSA